jgi:hypothetical protein
MHGKQSHMSEFEGLDLQSVEEQLEVDDFEEGGDTRVVLGFLDGTTPPEEWVSVFQDGHVMVLQVDGDLNELAAGFARQINDAGGELMHFRGALIITPPGVDIDTARLD